MKEVQWNEKKIKNTKENPIVSVILKTKKNDENNKT